MSGIENVNVPQQLTKWRVLQIEIAGVTPLLMHNPAIMRGASEHQLGKKQIPSPEEEAKLGRYCNECGELYIKSDMLRQSMIVGAAGLKINKKSAPIILAASVMELPDSMEFPMLRGGVPLSEYSVDVRRCVVQRNGVLRARPRVELPWALVARFLVDVSVVGSQAEPVISALSRAGQIAGIGDYRPQKKGSFGRYEVLSAGFEVE